MTGAVGSVTAEVTADVTKISGGTVAADRLQELMAALHSDTTAGAAAGSITLEAGASADDNYYRGMMVLTTTGTGIEQCRIITAYNGTSKVATIEPNWTVTPVAPNSYILFPASVLFGLATAAKAEVAVKKAAGELSAVKGKKITL